MINKTMQGITGYFAVASTVVAGDPVVVGGYTGVAKTSYDAVTGMAAVDLSGAFALSVKAINDAGNSAVAIGDVIYFVTGDTPQLSKKGTAGVPFGVARAIVTTGATTTIDVDVYGLQAPEYRVLGAHVVDAATNVSVTGSDHVTIGTLNDVLNLHAARINSLIAAAEKNKLLALA